MSEPFHKQKVNANIAELFLLLSTHMEKNPQIKLHIMTNLPLWGKNCLINNILKIIILD